MMPVRNPRPRAYKWVMKPSRDLPDELLGVAEQLEDHRPQLSGLEADRIKLRAMANGAKTTTHTSTKGTFMRSRLAITSLLAFGLLTTGSGAALGVSALTVTGSASQAQYGQGPVQGPVRGPVQGQQAEETDDDVASDEDEGVLGDNVASDEDEGVLGDNVAGDEGGDVAGVTAAGGLTPVGGANSPGANSPLAAAQAPRQLESGDSAQLPFTGYAAIPTLLIGIGLLAMGLILRRNPGRPTA